MARKSISPNGQATVLLRSRRRCCICFGLNRDTSIKQGQLAHLDGNSANSSEDNLAFLCLDHHDQYDSTTRQSKNFNQIEVKEFRTELHTAIKLAFDAEVFFGEARSIAYLIPGHYIRELAFESAEIRVQHLADGRYHISGIALWGTKRFSGPNIGELDFISELNGNTIEYSGSYPDGKEYRAKLQFSNSNLVVTEENWVGIFGMNVNFSGDYSKTT